jgi:hypothetical protein
MTAIDERKALERLSLSWRKLIGGPKAPPPAAPPGGASPPAETPVLPAQAGPGPPTSRGG